LVLRLGHNQVGLLFGVDLHLIENLLGVHQGALEGALPFTVLLDFAPQLPDVVGQAVMLPLQLFEGGGRLLEKCMHLFGVDPSNFRPKTLLLDVQCGERHDASL
jgi:hypothetical protein